ncbi:MAG: TMEM175 family protein [Streptococcaceae bacterium]|nr:TMEM175 family protein [Streptococcaceae bacterium]
MLKFGKNRTYKHAVSTDRNLSALYFQTKGTISMSNERINAFSDGVFAILITIMVLELKTPSGPSLSALMDLKFVFFTYFVSFITIAIYWNNHHHIFYLLERVSGRILWWNMALLFFTSFLPFSTAWLSQYPAEQMPEILYGLNCLLVDIAFNILAIGVYKQQGLFNRMRDARWFWKAVWSIGILMISLAICLVFSIPFIVIAGVIASLLPWAVPDRQIEKGVNQ